MLIVSTWGIRACLPVPYDELQAENTKLSVEMKLKQEVLIYFMMHKELLQDSLLKWDIFADGAWPEEFYLL